MTRIKICGITRVEDGLACARLGADAIGLVFYAASPRAVSLVQAREIVQALPPFVSTVALFVNPTAAEVEAVLQTVRPDLLQFHGDETPAFCAQFGVRYLKAVAVKVGHDLLQSAALYRDAAGLLLDTPTAAFGGSGAAFDWALIPPELAQGCVLAGGLTVENVDRAIAQVRPWAVDVSSGVEVEKGIKAADKIAAFIKKVSDADSA
ncbi:MAG: phosphoribosylanthranilate isomerase [Betaproteobacteria bacterium]|nr:MAG: phosphoribosylanthranilate isomerase [Betaproteobacteria bacterium]